MPGTPEFISEYEAAIATATAAPPQTTPRPGPGSFSGLCLRYYASVTFKQLDQSTQRWRRRTLDEIGMLHGHKPVAMMRAKHIRMLRDEKSQNPGVANQRVKALRALFRWAVEAEEVENNPARDVQHIRYVTSGHHSWTAEELATFEKAHPVGTKPRLAFGLLLYTACRREDVVRLGPQHIACGRLRYIQAKNEHRNPVNLDIPVHPDLKALINETPSQHLTFLVTEFGKPFSPAGFGNRFREWCDEAGLPHCTAHGLRKAAAVRLAERGATAHEIMAITGHKTLEEVERYTRAVQKARLADSAMAKM